jgi:hypothetical protein
MSFKDAHFFTIWDCWISIDVIFECDIIEIRFKVEGFLSTNDIKSSNFFN